MRSLIITQNVTLDGSVEMLEHAGWFDPQSQSDELLAEMHRQDAMADALLVGRRTFEDLRGYWPRLTDDRTGVTAYLNGVDKYLVSSSMTDPAWANSTILRGDPVTETRSLTALPGRDIVVTGSITLCHALIAADLVDEYRFFTYPFVQGGGRRLFPDGCEFSGFAPAAPVSFPGGVVLTRWRRDRTPST